LRLLLLALTLLAGSVLLTQRLMEDPGYLLLSYGHWSLETSLAVAGLLLLLFALVSLLLRLLAALWQTPRRLRAWEQRNARRQARRALLQGLVDLAEGNWPAAERNLVRHADRAEMPLINYPSAARAAQQQAAHRRHDRYLRLAHQSMPEAQVAVRLTQAELQLAHRQYEQALATLMYLRQVAPHHSHVLRLLRILYERLEDWRQLRDLLPALRRRRIGEAAELDALERRAQHGLLLQIAARAEPQALTRHWEALPRALRADPVLVRTYADCLRDGGDEQAAEVLLRSSLGRRWSPELVERYGRLAAPDPRRQLEAAEGWLADHPRDSSLLLALGRLCVRNRLWGKARSYFEASIGIGGSQYPDTWRELGALLERMGENDAALACYRSGLGMGNGSLGPPEQKPGTDSPAGTRERKERGVQPVPERALESII
jgi:HemY protein